MFPWNFGFHWTTGSIIFLGAFYSVLSIVVVTVTLALRRSRRDALAGRTGQIRWLEDFHHLPARDRACRHELTGEFDHRECPNAFDCRACAKHAELIAASHPVPATACEAEIGGMIFPLDRLYHRGHTWVRPESDGSVTVGLDELSRRVVGVPDQVELPPPGTHLSANGTAWRMKKRNARVRVLSPVDGEVVETGGPNDGWYLRVRPVGGCFDLRHLLTPYELRPWILREWDRLQIARAPQGVPTLADGGVPVSDMTAASPDMDWDTICGELFLES